MIRKQDILADMHTHTVASLHAYSTIKENLEVAKKNSLSYMAVTDHYMNDGTLLQKKNETSRLIYLESTVNRYEETLQVIGGAEFNIGQEIAYWDKIKKLRWRPIGLHSSHYDIENSDLNMLYDAFDEATEKHNCFAHIEREMDKLNHGEYTTDILGYPVTVHSEFKLWVEAICILAKQKDIYLEVNESSIKNCYDRMRYWIKYAKSNRNLISLGTDAHYCEDVGKFDNVIRLLNEVNYPKELILNCNQDMLDSLH